ncbi:MAG: pyridoxal-phosphate dependent enzyme [Proteobacteria bacterium]|nr:pyridoxal-phosphate dependent enzyme [Pseudomonadota bacterium]
MNGPCLAAVSLADIGAAQARLGPIAVRSPLLPCQAGEQRAGVFLKLENLQSIGSFKIRPVGNAVLARPASALDAGLYTLSSGNSALAVAWIAKRLGLAATAVIAPGAPQVKIAGLRALGAQIVEIPFESWWNAVGARGLEGQQGTYIDAARDPAALAGNGTIGIEILEDLPDVEAIFAPFGGGALACGIACAVRALKPGVKVIACELETAQPFSESLRAGRMVSVPSRPGFVSGVGFHSLLPEIWPLARELIDGTVTVSLAEVAAAIAGLAERNKVIAEGAGAIAVAAALSGRHPYGRVCAVVSGGNLDSLLLATILTEGIHG